MILMVYYFLYVFVLVTFRIANTLRIFDTICSCNPMDQAVNM